MGLGASGERCYLFMADMNPLHLRTYANRIRDSVERISADAINSLNSCFQQNVYKQFSYSLCHVSSVVDLNEVA